VFANRVGDVTSWNEGQAVEDKRVRQPCSIREVGGRCWLGENFNGKEIKGGTEIGPSNGTGHEVDAGKASTAVLSGWEKKKKI